MVLIVLLLSSRPPQRARDLRRRGMRAPDRRASLSAMATACFRFRTFPPEPERRVRCLYSRITLLTLPRPFAGRRPVRRVVRFFAISGSRVCRLLIGRANGQLVLDRLHPRHPARLLGTLCPRGDGGHLAGQAHHAALRAHLPLPHLPSPAP